jgi:hypothetical protein
MADINLGVGGANSAVAGGYDIENSLKFEPDNSEMLYTNSLTAGNRRTWTISMWVKRTELSYESAFMYSQGNYGNIRFFTQDQIIIENHNLYLITNRRFRDTSAWYHVVWVNDSTQATASNRSKLYINGVQETSFSTETYMSQNEEGNVNSTSGTYIGRRSGEVKHFAGYIADVYKVDGQALAPTDFGEFDEDSGIWIPKEYTGGGYGTQGFHLDFSDSSDLGNDSSGENNDFLLQNITSADQATDTPTNNFAVMNVLNGTNSDITTSQGGTKVSNSGSSICSMNATMGVSNGKWYWECRFANDPGNTNTVFVGIAAANDPYVPHNSNNYLGQQSGYGSIGWYFVNGGIYNGTGTWTGPGYGNIIMFALDMDNLKLYFGKEGTWQNSSNPETNTNGIDIATSFASLSGGTDIILPAISVAGGDNMDSMNFGGFANYTQSSPETDENGYGTFEYAPPSGYYALCTKNLAEFG